MFPIFIMGKAGSGVSTGWDLSAFTPDKPTLVYGYDSTIGWDCHDIVAKTDGTKLYFLDSTNDEVDQFSLSTAWDMSTISSDSKNFSHSTEEPLAQGLATKSDGTSMYVVGSNYTVYQYDLSTAWDASTGSYASKSHSFSAEFTTTCYGIAFKSDGTKMYAVTYGGGTSTIYQYSLSTAWDVSTGSYDSKSFADTTQGQISGLRFKDDGLTAITWDNDLDFVRTLTLSTAWDISTASRNSDTSMKPIGAQTQGFCIGDSGNKLYAGGPKQYQMDLGAAWSTTQTKTPDKADEYDASAQISSMTALFVGNGGTKLYILDNNDDDIHQYTMSTAYDLSTASYDSKSFSTTAEDTNMKGMWMDSTGTRLFCAGQSGAAVYRYTLSTAWDISTASYASDSVVVSGQVAQEWGIWFKADGTKFFISDDADGIIYQYSLSTAWDLSTTSYDLKSADTNTLIGWGAVVYGTYMYLNVTGDKMIVLSKQMGGFFEFDLSTEFDISTATFGGNFFYIGESLDTLNGRGMWTDGTEYYAATSQDNTVYHFTDPA